MTQTDSTHDAQLTSWVESANDPSSDFPIQNLPLGVFRHRKETRRRIGVAIGDAILDVDACVQAGLLPGLDARVRDACSGTVLNALLALGSTGSRNLRKELSGLLRTGSPNGEQALARRKDFVKPMSECTVEMPVEIGDYTDFYASVHHATNVGAMFRPDNPLLPNYKWVPIGYHGRASSIVPSGTPIRRPQGQTRPDANAPPVFGATRSLDYELEVGAFIGVGNALGYPINLRRVSDHMFGLCLVNDWSARDVQSWEYQPLGPFLAKNFATTISPWIVTLDALAPFRKPPIARPASDPQPLAYLDDPADRASGAFDITLEARLLTSQMRAAGMPAQRLSRSSFDSMYWTLGQMLVHHASNGCNLRTGDLIASGTVSGPSAESRGCMLELTQRGRTPVTLPTGETRSFLEDGDEVSLHGWCERPGFRRIGFGECRGAIGR